MRWTAFFLLVACMQAAGSAYSQTVTIKEKYTSYEKLFHEIKKQTGYLVSYNDAYIKIADKVKAKCDNAPLKAVLEMTLYPKGLGYYIMGNTVFVTSKEPAAIQHLPQGPVAPKGFIEAVIEVRGRVTDETGEPLAGVSIQVKGNERLGTSTGPDGYFELTGVDENAILLIRGINIEGQEIRVEGRKTINVTAITKPGEIGEVVVVGYGTEKKINLTGALNVIGKKDLENRPVAKISQLLQGQAPGLVLTNTTAGGAPDAAMFWQIRGQGTPFILVDGVPMDVNTIDPNNIENVVVLKDASSAAIYGARAAYGVVLITTKNGKKHTDKPEISYTTNFSWSKPTTLPDPMNSLEFATWWNEAAANSGVGKVFSDEVIANIKAHMADPLASPVTIPEPTNPSRWGRMQNANANTNWFNVFYKDFTPTQRHNLSITGNTKKSNYYLSASYLENKGLMVFGDDKYKRYTVSSNINTDINNWIRFHLKTVFTRTDSDWPQDGYGGTGLGRDVLFHDIARRWPTDPVTTPDGQWGEMSRIHIYESGARDKYNDNNVWVTFGGELEPVKDLLINYDHSFNYQGYNRQIHQPDVYLTDLNGNQFIPFDIIPPSQLYKQVKNATYLKFDIYLTYTKKLNDHYFKIIGGHNRESQHNSLLASSKQNLITNTVPSFNTAIGHMINDDILDTWAIMGYFSRINYNYKDKYLLELNGRSDGSYKYRKEDRWGFFSSASVGYRISEEPFWRRFKEAIPGLKVRASYGSLGDQNGLVYNYLPIMNMVAEVPWIGNDGRPATVHMPGILSESLTWEKLSTLNFGLDAEFLKGRLMTTIDIFNKDRTGIVTTGRPLPRLLGAVSPNVNNDAIRTTGWELSLQWKDRVGTNFRYDVELNLERHISRVRKTDNPANFVNINYVGKRIGEIWGYRADGLFQSEQEIADAPSQSEIYGVWFPGEVRYTDLNGDNKISQGAGTLENHGDMTVLGNSIPSVYYSFKGSVAWKDFDMSIFWSGIGKYSIWFPWNANMFWGMLQGGDYYWNSGFKPHLDYWTPENPNGYFPRLSFDNNKNKQVNSRYLQNGAYLRLRNVQFGYNLPAVLIHKISLKQARVYISGENLLTFTSLVKTFDPEVIHGSWGNGKAHPLGKSFSFGLALTL